MADSRSELFPLTPRWWEGDCPIPSTDEYVFTLIEERVLLKKVEDNFFNKDS